MFRKFYLVSFICFSFLIIPNSIQAQSGKSGLDFDDIRHWRSHDVNLSNDGKWYTTLYSYRDKPEDEKDSIAAQKFGKFYDEFNQTDVLYIHNSNDGVKYQIPKASKPVFSASSEWIAYQIESQGKKKGKDQKKKEKTSIELRHLSSGFTVTYESSASFKFWEDKNYFITSDKSTVLVYDLENRREHYLSNVGEYVLDKDADVILYTIDSEDKRGNGIYIYISSSTDHYQSNRNKQ